MTRDTAQRHPIVVGVDGSQSALRATRWAAHEAAIRHTSLLLLHARTLPAPHRARVHSQSRGHNSGLLSIGYEVLGDAWRAAVAVAPDVPVRTLLQVAKPAAMLIEASRTARLVVVGSRGLGPVSALLLGSVAAAVSADAACPVVVVRGGDPAVTVAPIVVGVDGSDSSDAAAGFAFDAAAARGSGVVALYTADEEAVTDGSASTLLTERLARWREKYPDVDVQLLVRRSDPAPVLVRQSESAQLLVVGSRGHGAVGFGSVSRAVLRHSRCPVAVVRAQPAAEVSREEYGG